MIQTIIISDKPIIIRHTLGVGITEKVAQKRGLLLDVSNYSFKTLEARRIWSLGFKMNAILQEKIDNVAIIGAPQNIESKEEIGKNSTVIKFLSTKEEGERWLLKKLRFQL